MSRVKKYINASFNSSLTELLRGINLISTMMPVHKPDMTSCWWSVVTKNVSSLHNLQDIAIF